MQLFTRRVQMVTTTEAMAYAVEMQALATRVAGREITLWNGLFGGPVGSLFYSTRAEGIADMAAVSATMAGNAEYMAKVDGGAKFRAGPTEDSLGTPLYGELSGDQPPVGAYASIVMAEIDNAMYEEALAWGADMAAFAEETTGLPGMFLSNDYGAFGGVTWISVAMDGAGVDAARGKLYGNPEYLKRLGTTKGMFRPGSGLQALITRIA